MALHVSSTCPPAHCGVDCMVRGPWVPRLSEPAVASTASEQAFRSLVEGAPDGIVISRDAIVLYANPAAVQLLGYESASEMVGGSMASFLDQAALTTMRMRLQRMR